MKEFNIKITGLRVSAESEEAAERLVWDLIGGMEGVDDEGVEVSAIEDTEA